MDKLTEAARNMGKEHGEKLAQSMVQLNIDDASCARILQGYKNGDESILMLCPEPLSGEWAGDPVVIDVISDLASLQVADELLANADIEAAMNASENVLDNYESAYREAFWRVIIEHCEKRLVV